MSFDSNAFKAKAQSDPDAVRSLLSTDNLGLADKFHATLEQLAGVDNSVLVNRTFGISEKIDNNINRIEFLTERLDRSRERLLLTFYNSELAIAKIQANLSAINLLAPIPPL